MNILALVLFAVIDAISPQITRIEVHWGVEPIYMEVPTALIPEEAVDGDLIRFDGFITIVDNEQRREAMRDKLDLLRTR